MKKEIVKYLISKITKAWENVKFPLGRKSSMEITDEELDGIRSGELDWYGEERDVEIYFQGKTWKQVEPYNKQTSYIPLPLNYMNDAAALYYSQCYLRYFVENIDEIDNCDHEYVNGSFSYFREYDNDLQLSNGQFHKLQNITKEQVDTVEEVTNFILPYVDLASILIGSGKSYEPIKTINTSYKEIFLLHEKIAEIEKLKTSESVESQIKSYKSIIISYENIIASYENIFTKKKKWIHSLNEKFSWFKK